MNETVKRMDTNNNNNNKDLKDRRLCQHAQAGLVPEAKLEGPLHSTGLMAASCRRLAHVYRFNEYISVLCQVFKLYVLYSQYVVCA